MAVGQNPGDPFWLVGAPPILEPVLVEVGLFGYDLDFEPWPYITCDLTEQRMWLRHNAAWYDTTPLLKPASPVFFLLLDLRAPHPLPGQPGQRSTGRSSYETRRSSLDMTTKGPHGLQATRLRCWGSSTWKVFSLPLDCWLQLSGLQ